MSLSPVSLRPVPAAPPLRPAAGAAPPPLRAPELPALLPAAEVTPALKTFAELTGWQRSLFGAAGARDYARLTYKQRAVFLLLTARMQRHGLDVPGLLLDDPASSTRPNRLLFAAGDGSARLRAALEGAIGAGTFGKDSPFGLFHAGRADFGAREDREHWSMQFGVGRSGAFVDIDRWHPWKGFLPWLGHGAEILVPGKPSALSIAGELGEEILSRAGDRAAA